MIRQRVPLTVLVTGVVNGYLTCNVCALRFHWEETEIRKGVN